MSFLRGRCRGSRSFALGEGGVGCEMVNGDGILSARIVRLRESLTLQDGERFSSHFMIQRFAESATKRSGTKGDIAIERTEQLRDSNPCQRSGSRERDGRVCCELMKASQHSKCAHVTPRR